MHYTFLNIFFVQEFFLENLVIVLICSQCDIMHVCFTGSNFLLTSSNSLWLHFGTDESESAAGFNLTLEPLGEMFFQVHLQNTFSQQSFSNVSLILFHLMKVMTGLLSKVSCADKILAIY